MNQDINNALDFDEKTVLRKSKFVAKLALKESFIWSIYTIKTSKLAFLCILGKVVPEKVVFFLYKKNLDQKISKYSVSESFVVQRVIFWIRNFKCVRPRTVFSQLDKFRIEKFRTCQISEKKVLQRIRFWNEIDLKKKQILMKVLHLDNHFGIVLPQNLPSFAALRFLKNQQLYKKMEKKHLSYQIFGKESEFATRFQQSVRLESRFSKLVSFSQFITNRPFVHRKFCSVSDSETSFYHTSDLERKF